MSFFSMDSPLMRFLNRMADLIVLNLLSILFAIPALISGYLTLAIYGETGQLPLVYLLITALLSFPVGASLTALHTVLIKMVKNEEGYIVKGFFKEFRDNFFQATAIGHRASDCRSVDCQGMVSCFLCSGRLFALWDVTLCISAAGKVL